MGDDSAALIYIYGLYESNQPVTNIRYIGQTINPQSRLSGHWNDKSKTTKAQWVQSLADQRKTVNMLILDMAESAEDANAKENAWILFGRALGWDLTNSTAPGEYRSIIEPEFSDRTKLLGAINSLEGRIRDVETSNRVLAENVSLLEKRTSAMGMQELEIATLRTRLDLHTSELRSWRKQALSLEWAPPTLERHARRLYKIAVFLFSIILFLVFGIMFYPYMHVYVGCSNFADCTEGYAFAALSLIVPLGLSFLFWSLMSSIPFYRFSLSNFDYDWDKAWGAWKAKLIREEEQWLDAAVHTGKFALLHVVVLSVVFGFSSVANFITRIVN